MPNAYSGSFEHLGTTMAGDEAERAQRAARSQGTNIHRTAEGITIIDYDPTTAPRYRPARHQKNSI